MLHIEMQYGPQAWSIKPGRKKMKKRLWLPKTLNILMIALMGLAVVSLIGIPWIIRSYIVYAEYATGIAFVKYYFTGILYLSGLLSLVVLYELKVIFKSCIDANPFVFRNVKSLRRIGFSSLIIGIMFVTKAILFPTFLTLIVIFVFLLAALFCFVLSDVFEEAVNYKIDNDLTI